MGYFKVELLEETVKEATRIEKEGGTIHVLVTWAKIEAERLDDAKCATLPSLQKTKFGKKMEKTYGRPLLITDILTHLRGKNSEDRRFGKPPEDFVQPLFEELKGKVQI